jgi:hypothetical protein
MESVGTKREFQANKPDVIIKSDKVKTFLLITVAVPFVTGKQIKKTGYWKKQLKYKSLNNIEIQGVVKVKCFVNVSNHWGMGIVAGGLNSF